jgi:hypothetical protein
MDKWLIYMDGQDEQDYLAEGFTALSSAIAYVPTQIPQNPLPRSWVNRNTYPIIERVHFLCRVISSRFILCILCIHVHIPEPFAKFAIGNDIEAAKVMCYRLRHSPQKA